MFSQLWRRLKHSDCEENQIDIPTTQCKKVLIVGAGIVGLTSAYYLSKFGKYDVTVVEKDYPIKGASEQNANTICIDMLPVFSSMNYLNVIKENLMFKENPTSYLRFSLIFESDFRYWLKHFIKCRSKERIDQSTNAVVKLSWMGFNLYDDYVLDITENQPDLVDYHQEVFSKIFKNFSKQDIAIKEKVVEITSKYDLGCRKYDKDILNKFNGANFGFEVTTKILNTDAFCRLGREKLIQKHGVQFIQGTVNNITYSDKKIISMQYLDENNKLHKLQGFENVVFCGGIESVNLGKLVGLKVPMYGFKGHSLNVYINKDKMPDSTYVFVPDNIVACRVGLNTSGMLRFTGFADVVGNDIKTIQFRKDQIVNFAKKYVGEENYDDSRAHHWVGLRPVPADDCPLIGQSSKFDNLYWNAGHGGRGVSQATSSALLLQTLMSKTEIPIGLVASDYSPSRFSV